MSLRVLVLSSLIAAAAITIVLAGPPVLAPADGSPIRIDRPNHVAVGDVNKDGHPDLVVATQTSAVTIFLGRGNGQFAPALFGAIKVPAPPDELALGDLTGDANLDLALGNHDSYGVTVLAGDGRSGFRLAPGSPVVMKDGRQPHTHGLAIADFNRDGKSDLVTVNSNDDNDVAVMLGEGNGRFARAPGSPFGVGQAPYPLAVGDLDDDGAMDLVVTSTGLGAPPGASIRSNLLTVLFGDGRGRFRRQDVSLRTNSTWFVAIADLNGDRKLDLAATHGGSSLMSVVLGDGRGGFTEAQGSPIDLGHNAFCIAIADLNRDGHPDALAAADEGVRVMLGDGRGGFATAPGSPFATGKGSWRLAVADVDSDGKPDVAASSLENNSVAVLLGR
jgi:FG-GAP-like repeat